METAVQQLEKATADVKELKAKIVEVDASIVAKDAEIKAAKEATAVDLKKVEDFGTKVKAFETEINTLKEASVTKDASIKELEAKVKLLPEVPEGTQAVADGTTDAVTVDHLAEFKKISNSKERGQYYKDHEKEINALVNK